MATAFTTPMFYKNIDTLSELDKSNLQIGTNNPTLIENFGLNGNPVQRLLLKKVKYFNGSSAIIDRVAIQRDISALERYSDLSLIISVKLYFQM